MDIATIVASVAGAVGSKIVFHPLDTIRTLQQTSTNFSYKLPLPRYWNGLGASVVLTTPAFTTYMVAYRQTKRELTPYFGHDSLPTYILSGASAELCSSFIWTPMEVVKGRMQINESGTSTFSLVRSIHQSEGFKGFFRGYWMGIAVFVPHSVVWWISYEKAKTFLVTNFLPPGSNNADLSPQLIATASAFGTISATSAANFLDVVKTRQQLAVSDEIKQMRPDDAKGVWTVAKNLVKEAGLLRAMVKGLHMRLMNAVPSGVLSMVIVETLNPDVEHKQSLKNSVEEEQILSHE